MIRHAHVARWDRLDAAKYRDERETVAALLAAQPLTSQARTRRARRSARALVAEARRWTAARAWSKVFCRNSRSARRKAWR